MRLRRRILIYRRYLRALSARYKNRIRYMLIVIGGSCCLAVILILYAIFMPVNTEETIVRIKMGENTRTVARNLKYHGVIRSATLFHLIARLSGNDRHLKAGRYVFGGNVNLLQTISKISQGLSKNLHLTIPEGMSLYQVLKRMDRSGVARMEALLKVAADPLIVQKLTGFEVKSLEGFLYPETYVFDIETEPEEIFGMMTREFFKRLAAEGIYPDSTENFYRKLILASIVEQEAVAKEEQGLIAGVYQNRLKKGMNLESCPTIDYILERKSIYRKKLFYNDLKMNSPYNTYVYSGLPPTPICNPGIDAIRAGLNPQKTDYLYFFADFKGRNVFSRSYAEHIAKQRSFQRKK